MRGWRLAARGVLPSGLRRFRLAVPDLRVLFLRIDANLDQGMLCHEWVGSWMVVNT